MTVFVNERFVAHVQRLALGIEPVDALRRSRMAHAIDVAFDGIPSRPPRWQRNHLDLSEGLDILPRVPRHDSCLHALLHRPGLTSPIPLRFNDRSRRFVPRRISFPIPADPTTPAPRTRRAAFFPGAAYDVSETATGLRGRVTWAAANEVVARWVRVEARAGGQIVGVAHGDDRGEFLLLLMPEAGGIGVLPSPLQVLVTVLGPQDPGTGEPAPPVPASLDLPAADPFWDLPLEEIPSLTGPDDVSPGQKPPPSYVSTPLSTREVAFTLGRLRTDEPKFSFTP